ncbi:phage portal protein [Cereibacter sphaeroides]|nr:phage portal protein [Cereibacter sphaeroides]
MGFLNILRRAPVEEQAARVEPSLSATSSAVESPTQWSGGFISSGPVGAGVRVDESSVIGLPGTIQALRILTGVFAMAPLIYYRRTAKGRERAEGTALYRLLHDAPNSHQSPFAFRELMLGDILLAGEFNAYVSRDRLGQPKALTRLKSGTCVPAVHFDPAEGETLFYDATLPDGTRGRFANRDILRIVGFTRDGIAGLSPLRFAREALGGVIATDRHAQRFWASGGRVNTFLKGKGKISPADKDAMRHDWERMYGGANGGSTAVLDQDVTAELLTADMQKQQFLETRQFNINDLARIWGVPPHLIFELSRSTNNNIEQQSLEFVLYHLGPHFARVDGAVTHQFAEEGFYFEHLTDALVKGDLKSRMEAYWLQRQMGMVSGNELRQRDNLSVIDGAAGNAYWRPSNMEDANAPRAASNGQG